MNGVSFSPNNQYVVSGSKDKTACIWDVESGDCIKTLEGHTSYVYGVSFSPNNQYVLSNYGKIVPMKKQYKLYKLLYHLSYCIVF